MMGVSPESHALTPALDGTAKLVQPHHSMHLPCTRPLHGIVRCCRPPCTAWSECRSPAMLLCNLWAACGKPVLPRLPHLLLTYALKRNEAKLNSSNKCVA